MKTPAVAQLYDMVDFFSAALLADLTDVFVPAHDTASNVAPLDKEQDGFETDG